MRLEKCGAGEEKRAKLRRQVHRELTEQGKIYSSPTRNDCLEAILCSAILLLCAQVTCARNVRQPLNDDLLEGRLDTSHLCGTRYPSKNDDSLFYIVGGNEVDDDQFWPWSVAIYELDPLNGQRAFICSGSLISDKFVLTAAHCIQQSRFDILSANEVFLKIAAVRLDDERVPFHEVESVYVHPEYHVDRKANDIALLKLATNQRLPARARPICLPSQVANRIDFTDQLVTIIGWGKTNAMNGGEPSRLIDVVPPDDELDDEDRTSLSSAGGGDENELKDSDDRSNTQTNDTLLQAEVRVTSTDQCNRNYSRLEISWLNIDEHFLCARDPQGKRDACQGDSGGPLMWNHQAAQEKWYQLGLVSFGHGCANTHFPGVYTRISYYMPWILKTVSGRGSSNHINGNNNHHNHH